VIFNRIIAVMAATLCLIFAGCRSGGLPKPSTEPVTGTVIFKGKPLSGVKITFHPNFDIGPVQFLPNGLTDKQGRFTLSTTAAGDGAPVGDYTVTLELPVVTTNKAGLETEVDFWKGKHADAKTSQWKVTIQKGENALEPYRLD
jgi:hypothetical protein